MNLYYTLCLFLSPFSLSPSSLDYGRIRCQVWASLGQAFRVSDMFAGAEGAHADPVWSQILLCLHTQSSEVSKFKDNVCICDCTIEGERERGRGRYCSTRTQVKIMCLLHIHCTTRKGKERNQCTERERERERCTYADYIVCVWKDYVTRRTNLSYKQICVPFVAIVYIHIWHGRVMVYYDCLIIVYI